MTHFESVLVANRGEIAVRIIRTLKRLGIRAVAVFSDADAGAPHVRLADQAIAIGPAPARDSYLDVEAIVAAALGCGAQAIHPGYGFLSERVECARACADAGVAFIGPPPDAIERLGDKVGAKSIAAGCGVPTVPGTESARMTDAEILAWAGERAGRLPLMVKAAAGGGGRGMRVVRALGELPEALQAARREARAAFGDDALLVERHVAPARHVEIQFLADAHGGAVHLGERECSLQRRHQKLVEECPSAAVSAALRARMGEAAVVLARAAGYVGAGTCEFLVPAGDADAFYFLEVNARLQVEHPVTELVYGLDLVEAQLRLAAGERLWIEQAALEPRGHAIEARVCAEDERDFLPQAGRIVAYREPSGAGIRVDSGVQEGSVVTTDYDSLLCKVIAHAPTRERALDRLDRALSELAILGPPTNTAFLRRLLAEPAVRAGALDTGLVERLPAYGGDRAADEEAAIAAALARTLAHRPASDDPWERLQGWRIEGTAAQRWRLAPERGGDPIELVVDGEHVAVAGGGERRASARAQPGGIAVTIDGVRRVWACARDGALQRVGIDGGAWAFREQPLALRRDLRAAGAALEAPMPGSVLAVRVRDGDSVSAGDVLVVLESMKMELEVVAPADGTVQRLSVAPGDRVSGGQLLVTIGEQVAA